MKVFNFLLTVPFIFLIYSQSIIAYENEPVPHTGRKGLTRERINHFERMIKENEERSPQLKVVKRSKPYYGKFPIDEENISTQIDQRGDISKDDIDDIETETQAQTDVEVEDEFDPQEIATRSFIDNISSDDENQSDVETNNEDINTRNVGEFDVNQDEVPNNVDQTVDDVNVGDSVNTKESADLNTNSSVKDKKKKSWSFPSVTFAAPKNQEKMDDKNKFDGVLEKQKLKRDKKEKKLRKKQEKERLRQDKEEKKRREKEEKNRLKEEKNKLKEKKTSKFDKFPKVGFSKNTSSDLKDDENKSSCSSKKGKKNTQGQTQTYEDTLEDRLNSQEVVFEDIHDDMSTVASENEIFENLSSNDIEHVESEIDIKLEKPKDDLFDSYSEDEESEIKARILAGNEEDFKTERISSEEAIHDSDSEYFENEDPHIELDEQYRFSKESEDIISKEKAVEPLERIDIEELSEDEETSNVSEAPALSSYSGNNEEEEEDDKNIQKFSNDSELSNDNLSEDPVIANHSIEEEIVIEDKKDMDEDFSNKDPNVEETGSKNKVGSFFGKIKSFFKRKPFINLNCRGPSCMKRLSKKDEPKYSNDFIPRIYLLSRDVPKEDLYRVPEIISSLRSESNRLVFAYQLMDGSLIPSSALALNSKSFVVRRWGKKVQTKLTKLRSEFDNLKSRLSSMYHEGVLKGEFELLIEEMDDLTIMLYLIAKEFPRKSQFANNAKDILRYPEVVSTPGERLISMFRKSKISKCSKKSCEPKPERSESDKLAIKALKKRMKFIKKRLNSLSK
ncbi:uncharacterized protein cubi_02522 [Cryptosporidium ubiquitum]|uniref:Signal peptide-containing protein n=1 Tax=Cryptosporidium ubiquitum TaxID=857276 RepID=A0A1J4MGA8_9CRYT|nr:uncharacterized protein cubi_02522 [Cryptosporidium ubiquitum]OII73290.1 hypothetical protein cubi_02522 [Cryptosporidium ubiquitum]